MKNYFNDPGLANGFALTYDFVKHMEVAGDTSLTGFFNDWFYGEGYPIYSAEYSRVDEGVLKITLSQTPTHSSVEFFEMPVPVRVYNFDKTDSLDFRLINTTNHQEFFVEVNFNVTDLKIDPDYWLVSKTSQIVGVQPDLQINKIVVFPNPFTGSFSIELPISNQLISLQLYNSEGNCLKKYYGNKTNFNWPDLPDGLYILYVTTTGGTFKQKLVKQ
jgi:hypothetical protein